MPRHRLGSAFFNMDQFRRRLASVDALPQLCLLAVFSGALTGLLMTAFRELIDVITLAFMPGGRSDDFESLAPVMRMALPLIAVTLIGVGLWRQPAAARKLGIGHVIERLTYHQGQMPLPNWLNQWWVGALTLIGGLSAGREGPAIHLGAGGSCWIGERLRLPHNSLRVLVGCGTAAGISASFNTPIAGVIFAMEVVMMEYTLTGFMPVILASATGAVVTQMIYGTMPAFTVPDTIEARLFDIPWIITMSLAIGLLAGGFIRLARLGPQMTRVPRWLRLLLAGSATAAVAFWYPQVQGIGYDTVGNILTRMPALDVLLVVAVGKLALTALTLACGVPVSIVGPILVSGAAVGALFGMAGLFLLPSLVHDPHLYAMLGMAAMMGAVLQAPLAAIMALIELTHNPDFILYGMLAVVVSGLTGRQVWHCRGFFISALFNQGLHPLQQPLTQALSRIAVPAVMERGVVRTRPRITRDQARALLDSRPVWLMIGRGEDKSPVALAASDLARLVLEDNRDPAAEGKGEDAIPGVSRTRKRTETGEVEEAAIEEIDLLAIPGQRLELASVDLQATLSEAFDRINEYGVDALYVQHTTAPMIHKVSGIITREAIENYYRYKR
ncbi:chloride channel protein [Kushneria phosphatilytica]